MTEYQSFVQEEGRDYAKSLSQKERKNIDLVFCSRLFKQERRVNDLFFKDRPFHQESFETFRTFFVKGFMETL